MNANTGDQAKGTLVFVPGVMGSGLNHVGLDSAGVPRNEVIWGEQLSTIWRTLAIKPELLSSSEVQVTGVIRQVSISKYRTESVYGPLIDFCCSKDGLNLDFGETFLPFPYDWRQDLSDTATRLDSFIADMPAPVILVAHSMGGLISRLMINGQGLGAKRVKKVFQIASPIGGSSKAYITLKKQLSIGPVVDAMWEFFHKLDPSKRATLMDGLANMPSLYQLLPPESAPILLRSGGSLSSAVDLDAWARRDHGMVAAAKDVHRLLRTPLSIPFKCVFSSQHQTDWLVAVDEHWKVLGTGHVAKGDGTVTSDSARTMSNDTHHFDGPNSEHTQLCSHPKVLEELRRFLA